MESKQQQQLDLKSDPTKGQGHQRLILGSTVRQLYPCPWWVGSFVNPELNYDLNLEDNWSNRGKKLWRIVGEHLCIRWYMLYLCLPTII